MNIVIDTKHRLSLHTHVYDKKGEEHYFKWIEVQNGVFISGEEVNPKTGETKLHGYDKQFDFYVNGIKNPKDVY